MRTTEADVIALCGTALTPAQVEPWLNMASGFVDRVLVGKGLTPEALRDIEKAMAAYYLTTARDPLVTSETIGDAQAAYLLGSGNPYGRLAMELDTTGTLAQIASGRVAGEIKAFG